MILWHLGLPKSASTWMDRELFTHQMGYYRVSSYTLRRTILKHPEISNLGQEEIRKWLDSEITRSHSQKLVSVLSDEALCFSDSSVPLIQEATAWIRTLVPNAKVVWIIREQKSWLYSSYKERFARFPISRDIINDLKSHNITFNRLKAIEYDKQIEYYHKMFGINNVLVLPFELLKVKPLEFARYILQFSGVEDIEMKLAQLDSTTYHNRSRTHLEMYLAKRLYDLEAWCLSLFGNQLNQDRRHKILRSPFVRLTSKLEQKVLRGKLNQAIETRQRRLIAEEVGDKYRASNRRTSELIGIDLAQYGYDV